MNDVKPEDIVKKLNDKANGLNENTFGDSLVELQRESDNEKSLRARENTGIFAMRDQWSFVVLMLIVAIVLFDMVLVCLYGLGVWNFGNPTVVIVVITDNFLKIFGLGFLITREIFKKIYREK
jgi:hypothetical protein